jgi:hypothetical protein
MQDLILHLKVIGYSYQKENKEGCSSEKIIHPTSQEYPTEELNQ